MRVGITLPGITYTPKLVKAFLAQTFASFTRNCSPLPILVREIMAELQDLQAVFEQLGAKMTPELTEGHHYEALQYVQSFVARKKKSIGRSTVSAAIFYGAKKLAEHNASVSAGTLLKWFIEDGAGAEHGFKLNNTELSGNEYCDIQNLIDFLANLEERHAFPVVDAVYSPLHLLVTKAKLGKDTTIAKRMAKFEEISARSFLEAGKYLAAFKAYIRLEMVECASDVLAAWSARGYGSEKPLFFARALIYLLAEGKVSIANELLGFSKKHIVDNIDGEGNGGGPDSGPLAVWHLATVLTDLANFPPMPRVDKAKLFGILYSRYGYCLTQMDPVLLELLLKAGEVVFNYQVGQQGGNGGGAARPAANPMAMLQGLFGAQQQQYQQQGASAGGSGGGSGSGTSKGGKGAKKGKAAATTPTAAPGAAGMGGMDLDQMMRMMERIQHAQPGQKS